MLKLELSLLVLRNKKAHVCFIIYTKYTNKVCNARQVKCLCGGLKKSPRTSSLVIKCLCGGRKKSPRTSSLVQLYIRSGISGSSDVIRCNRKLNTAPQAGARAR